MPSALWHRRLSAQQHRKPPLLWPLEVAAGKNHFILSAVIEECGALRQTHAGLAALDFSLCHETELEEAGARRRAFLRVKALALGGLAESVRALGLGAAALFGGFLLTPGRLENRAARSIVFHVTELTPA